jgi:hypothetical protein
MISIEVIMCDSFMNATREVVMKVISELSIKYNFDMDEALRLIDLNGKSPKSNLSNLSKASKASKALKVKPKFALPYSGELDELCCQGLSKNQGLYTQCLISRMDSGEFCKSCQTSADLNNGVPEYGTIESRLKAYTEGIEYKDPSGKSPVPYAKVMKKLKLTREEVEEEAGKLNMVINPIHFETDAVKKSGRPALKKKAEGGEVKPKGRPKKAKKVLELAGEEEDLFASLVMSANKKDSESEDEVDENADTVIMSESEEEEEDKKAADEEAKLAAKSAEEEAKLAAKLAAEEEAKLAAKLAAEEEAKLAAKKAADEEAKLAAKLAAEAKKETERLEKEAKKKAIEDEKEAKKKAIEDEKEAKKKAIEAKKEAERLEKEAKKKAVEEKKPKKEVKKSASAEVNAAASDGVEEEEEEEPDVVKKFEFEGKKYLKSKKSGIIYNMEQDKIGKWNEAKQRIDFDVIEEESCDEYDA